MKDYSPYSTPNTDFSHVLCITWREKIFMQCSNKKQRIDAGLQFTNVLEYFQCLSLIYLGNWWFAIGCIFNQRQDDNSLNIMKASSLQGLQTFSTIERKTVAVCQRVNNFSKQEKLTAGHNVYTEIDSVKAEVYQYQTSVSIINNNLATVHQKRICECEQSVKGLNDTKFTSLNQTVGMVQDRLLSCEQSLANISISDRAIADINSQLQTDKVCIRVNAPHRGATKTWTNKPDEVSEWIR